MLGTRRVGTTSAAIMAPKNKGKSAPASTAAAPALSLQKVALVVLTALLCLSLATKVQGLSPLYGPNKLYAGGLLPLSEVYEIGTLALLYVDRPIGVIALFAYIGDAPSSGSWPWPRKLVMTPTCCGGFAVQKGLALAAAPRCPLRGPIGPIATLPSSRTQAAPPTPSPSPTRRPRRRAQARAMVRVRAEVRVRVRARVRVRGSE